VGKPDTSGNTGWAWVFVVFCVFAIWIYNSGSGQQGQPPATPVAPLAGAGTLPAAPTALEDQEPPVGQNNVLSVPQIRWCKRERIRADAIQGIVNTANGPEVDFFNAGIDELNSRCGSYRYRQAQLEQVAREVATEQESIASLAKMDWVKKWPKIPDAPGAQRAADPAPGLLESLQGASPASANPQTALSAQEQSSIDSACSDQKLVYGAAAYEKCVLDKKTALIAGPRHIDLSGLNALEYASIESACSNQRLVEGPAPFNACLVRKLADLQTAPRHFNLLELSQAEWQSLESSCSDPKLLEGPGAYYRCLASKIASLRAGPRNIDLTHLSDARRASIESACSDLKLVEGPAAYNQCVAQKLGQSTHE